MPLLFQNLHLIRIVYLVHGKQLTRNAKMHILSFSNMGACFYAGDFFFSSSAVFPLEQN